jgi:phage minor structural protein
MAMIKIFNATDTDFKTAGNIIINPLHCHEIKKKSLNGWYIEVEIPIKYKEYIEADKLCVVKTKSKLKPQAFRINDSIAYTNRKIKFTAEHVMFDSRRYVLLDVRPTNLNGQNGLKYVNERTDKTSPFSIDSNVENVSTAYFIRKTLLESWQVFEERWGGVFEADNWDISFKQSIGKDNGETIVYGKNMQGFEIFEDWSNVCTKILPVGYDGLLLPEEYLESETQYEIPYTKIVDFQTDLKTEEQTETNLLVELRNNASKYLEENCVPKVSYTVNSNVNNDLEIGDTIKVLHPFVNIFTEVLEYEYDLISEKVKSLTFGNYTRDVKTKFNNIKNTIETIKQTVSKQEITIKEQTNLINSLNKNGYVYIDDNEILILDQLPKEKAKNVWRFGLGGIGFSSKGYEGPFETAITMDGKINADFITTGTMAVDRIESLANFITETNSSISKIELEQGKITSKVSSVEQSVENITKIEGTAEGKNIYIDDASAEPLIDIMLEGESQQATRSGKNLLDNTATTKISNGITFTVNSDGTVLVDGTNDTSANSSLVINRYDLSPGTYILNGCPSGGASNTYRLAIQETGSYSILGSIDIGNGSGEFTIDATTSVQIAIFIQKGLTINNLLFKPMLREATIADDTYEQYGASPSTDYLSKIENLEGENICPSLNTTRTINGVTFTKNKDGSITMNGTATAEVNYPINVNTTTNTRTVLLKANSKYRMLSSYESGKYITQVFYLKNNATTYTSSLIETVEETKAGMYIRVYKDAVLDNVTIYPQITKGEEYKPYVPYNSLGFLDIGENLIKAREYSATVNNVERSITNGLVKLNGTMGEAAAGSNAFSIIGNWTANYSAYDTSIEYIKLKAGTYTLSIHNVKGSCTEGSLALVAGNTNPKKTKAKIQLKNETSKTFTLEEESICRISVEYNVGCTFNNFEFNVMLNKGSQAPYIPYQEQAEYFPLSEGQKLYKGSYLADDGTHHKRKQIVLDGSDNRAWYMDTQSETSTDYFYTRTVGITTENINSVICSHFKKGSRSRQGFWATIVFCITMNKTVTGIISSDTKAQRITKFKTWLATQYANGTPVIVEYEPAEEEIVPYTETQQEAWEKLRHFTLFKGINNITSTANAKITYVRDNGLSDIYETKRNVKENHYTKIETDSQISQTADSIKESVKAINEQTQEKLATLELANQSLKFATKRVGGNNLIRNSAMINDNNFWLAHAKYPYQESDTPLDNPTEGAYWYCTANSGSYIENQMYVYNSSGWQVSELSRKSLLSAQNYFAYTTSNEYWANGKNANENTLSGRVIKLDGRQDYTVSHIFNITEPITLNQNENKMAISYFIKNSIVQGNVCVGLMFLNEADFTEVEKPYSLYEPGIILTPDDLKDLTKIEQIIEIPKKSDFIPVVVSNTAPTDTTKNWLDTTIYLPKKYNSQTSQWEILDTKMSLYNESSREVWTYRYFYGFYYQTPIIYDTAEIKSCYVALTFYPAFAVYTGNVEPTPYKGLYWNNKTTNLVKRAKYNDTTFVEWEILDIPSSLLPTGASLGVELFDYIVPIKGFVEIADLKLEYNTMCTQWTQFPGEVYGKNYKMDEKGFWIQANQNTMFIDEDEILATYKGINIFQINKDLAYFYKIQATESIEIGNYFLKTQQINSKNMLLLY